jgi:hypothetical protein
MILLSPSHRYLFILPSFHRAGWFFKIYRPNHQLLGHANMSNKTQKTPANMKLSHSFSNNTLSSPSPSSLPPRPPPPSPYDTLLDIAPHKSSLSMAMGSASCAFPSWPNRSSLLRADSDTVVSSYLSDEDLLPAGTPSSSSETAVDEESGAATPVIGAPDLTIEVQIQMIHAAAEEDEQRLRFLARVHAHARAQQAHRAALAAAEPKIARRKKRRPVVDRLSSSTKRLSL